MKEQVKEKIEEKEQTAEENKKVATEVKIESKKKNDIPVIITIVIVSIVCITLACYLICIKGADYTTEIKLSGKETIELEAGTKYKEEGVIAKCNNKDVSNKVKITSNVNEKKTGNYTVQYNLTNKILHIDKTVSRNVIVKDTTAPEITIDGEKEQTIYIGDKFTVPTCKAIDNYDGDITSKVKVKSNVDISKAGTYTVNYSVEDSNENEAKNSITVNVKKKKNPHIVVSIAKQTLTYYEYDKVVLSSSIVTGKDSKTPTGNFKVLNKATNIILKGKDYESFVNYWIAFKGASFGFHDASWRSNFGGKIYKTAGSHGCVNMPYNKVKQLYNIVAIGTPVYIK